MPVEEFPRMKRLPPYVFATVNALKMEARRRGEDIIDLGMGNPDLPTPQHIVDKLIEAAGKGANHRYSASKGITKLRVAISDWYKRRFDVDIDPETEAIATIGAKEGLSHLVLATVEPGDVVLVPNPTYPIHSASVVISGGQLVSIPSGPRPGFFRGPGQHHRADPAPAHDAHHFLSPQPHHPVRGSGVLQAHRGVRQEVRRATSSTTSPTPTWSSTIIRRPASSRCPGPKRWGWSSSPSPRATTCRAGAWASWWATSAWSTP